MSTDYKLVTNLDFQKSVLKLAFINDGFAARFCHYLKDDVYTKDFMVFTDHRLTFLFKVIYDSLAESSTSPGRAQVLDRCSEHEKKAQEYVEAYESVMATDIKDSEYFKEKILKFIKVTKVRHGNEELTETYGRDKNLTPEMWLKWAESISQVTLDPDTQITLSDIPRLMADIRSPQSAPLSTGIRELDEIMLGGFPRGGMVSVLSVQNAGKSLATVGFGANALRAIGKDGKSLGLKVLHIPLEGTMVEAPFRYASNLADIDSRVMRQGDLTEEQSAKLKAAMARYQDRLLIYPKLKFGTTIEEIVSVTREVYKTFKFDMCIVDYGRLLTIEHNRGVQQREILERVHQGLSQLAKEFRCVMMTPVQANRDALKQRNEKDLSGNKEGLVITSDMIGEAYAISHVSEVILSINANKDEMENSRLRLHLEKQRHEKNNVTLGLRTNFKHSNLITGETYELSDVTVAEGVSLGEKTKAMPKGEQRSEADVATANLRDAVDKMKTRKRLLADYTNHKNKAASAAAEETKQRHLTECRSLLAKSKVLESQALDLGKKVFGANVRQIEPALVAQMKEMMSVNSTATPEKIEEHQLTVELVTLMIETFKIKH